MNGDALIEKLAKQAEQRKYEAGETIIRQGDRADAFYVLVLGSVEVVRKTDGGNLQHVSSLTAPAFFGEVGLMEDGRRTATVRAAESPVEVLVVAKEAFTTFVGASEMMADEIAALLQRHRINDSLISALSAMPRDAVEQAVGQAKVLTYAQGDKIICQGDPADLFYILTKGRVEVLHQREDGRTYLINFHEPGEYFGEIGLLQDRPRSATVRAAEEIVEVLAFDKRTFQEIMGKSFDTESAIAAEVARRLERQDHAQ